MQIDSGVDAAFLDKSFVPLAEAHSSRLQIMSSLFMMIHLDYIPGGGTLQVLIFASSILTLEMVVVSHLL